MSLDFPPKDLHHRLCYEANVVPEALILERLGGIPSTARKVDFTPGVEGIVGAHYKLESRELHTVFPTLVVLAKALHELITEHMKQAPYEISSTYQRKGF